MSNLKYWEDKIKQKRKNTDFREFVKEIASWSPIILYKNQWKVSRYNEKIKRVSCIDNNNYNSNYESINAGSSFDFDFSDNFFANFNKTYSSYKFPFTYVFPWLWVENCEFSDVTHASKNVYLSFFTTTWSENVLYSYSTKQSSKNVLNSISIGKNSENIYLSSFCLQSYNIFYSYNIHNSSNIWFSSNLIWCSECLLCNWLENMSYCINNKQYEKKEYLELKKSIITIKEKFNENFEYVRKNTPINFLSLNSSGYCLYNSEDINNSLFCWNLKNGNNSILIFSEEWVFNSYDSILWWSWNTNNIVWQIWSWLCENIYLSIQCWTCNSTYYSLFLENCSFCLWCIWLKNKSYCILNKQYTKEEWYELADKIFSQMESEGTLWEFFPWEINPFYFNDTMAYLIDDSFTKEEVEKQWNMWRDEEIKVDIPEWVDVIKTTPPARASLPPQLRGTEGEFVSDYQWYDSNWNWQINPEILKKVIKDEKWNIYRIVQMEYDFLMKHWLPLPEIHWLDRIKMWFKFK